MKTEAAVLSIVLCAASAEPAAPEVLLRSPSRNVELRLTLGEGGRLAYTIALGARPGPVVLLPRPHRVVDLWSDEDRGRHDGVVATTVPARSGTVLVCDPVR